MSYILQKKILFLVDLEKGKRKMDIAMFLLINSIIVLKFSRLFDYTGYMVYLYDYFVQGIQITLCKFESLCLHLSTA